MEKVQFNYEVWKNHPEQRKIKLVTRSGDSVSYFNDVYVGRTKYDKPLIGLVDDKLCTWGIDGSFLTGEALHDLFMILPEEPEMWVLMNKVRQLSGVTYATKEDAEIEKQLFYSPDYQAYKLVKQ